MKKKGFTLIELLVVISIMSILTIITVGQFVTARKRSRDVKRKGDLNSLSKALNMYFTDYGYFPPSNAGQVTGADWGGEFDDNGYVYMKVMPEENVLETPYCYVTEEGTEPKKYALFANLEIESDPDVLEDNQDHCGGETYNYGIVSPNVGITDFNGTLP